MLKVLISLTNGVLKLRGCALGMFCDPQIWRTSEDVLAALRVTLTMSKVWRLYPRAPLLMYAPLLAHIVPTLLVGYGLVIPNSPIAGSTRTRSASLPQSQASFPLTSPA
jgi:hypothetical protein